MEWLIPIGGILLLLGAGVFFQKKSQQSAEEFLLAGRSFPGFLLAISMVATTFASDTPLAVSGLTLQWGLGGNWLWWCQILSFSFVAVFLAEAWRRLPLLTDVHLLEFRYPEQPAIPLLRKTKGILLGLFLNMLILAWVILGLEKFLLAFQIPGQLGISERALSGIFMGFVLVYSILGGMRAIVLTDLLQFLLVIGITFYLAFQIFQETSWKEILHTIAKNSPETLQILPPSHMLSVLFFSILWWAHISADGSGYFAQRLFSARSPRIARNSLWLFIAFHFFLRMIPWTLIILGGLALLPASQWQEDPEQLYALTVSHFLNSPVITGLFWTALLFAFMSTVDTHIHWGAGYFAVDVLPSSGPSISRIRLAMLILGTGSWLLAGTLPSITHAWLLAQMWMGGLGLVHILRWIWWKISIRSEWIAILLPLILGSLALTILPDAWLASLEHQLYLVAGISLLTGLAVILEALCRKLDPDPCSLIPFVERVHPPGFWKSVWTHLPASARQSYHPLRSFISRLSFWILVSLLWISGFFLLWYLGIRLWLPPSG